MKEVVILVTLCCVVVAQDEVYLPLYTSNSGQVEGGYLIPSQDAGVAMEAMGNVLRDIAEMVRRITKRRTKRSAQQQPRFLDFSNPVFQSILLNTQDSNRHADMTFKSSMKSAEYLNKWLKNRVLFSTPYMDTLDVEFKK